MRLPLAVTVGSSPLARGTLLALELLNDPVRLIPARAGNTRHGGRYPPVRTAHPRSRGEHFYGEGALRDASGSSPLARGTQYHGQYDAYVYRLIPARAGNTLASDPQTPSTPAHPRSRGEHTAGLAPCSVRPGSSPLARGTRGLCVLKYPLVRLIPARAGNTLFICSHTPSTAAHPRSRGEHHFLPLGVLAPGAAHPRSRGEHTGKLNASPVIFGSSPLARGTPLPSFLLDQHTRLIPARAGNTVGRCSFRLLLTAHPRSRGEHTESLSMRRIGAGSSPLARGTLQCA